MVNDDDVPLLRTFRSELTKRSSLLVDDDMREYFTQQFEGPTPSQANYVITPEQMFKSVRHIRPESTMTAELAEVRKTVQVQPLSNQTGEVTTVQSNRSSLTRLSETLRTMESSAFLPATSVTATSVVTVPKQQFRRQEQTVITVKKDEVTPRGQILHVTAFLNPQTSQKVALVEALQSGLIDARTKTFIDPSTRQRMSLSQAAKKGYIDEVVLKQLTSPCGSHDAQTGQELSLLDAIQKKLYDPVTNAFTDATTGEQVPVSEAVARGILSESCSRILAGEKVELTCISHTQAVFAHAATVKSDWSHSLGKVLQESLCNEITGKVTEPL